MKGGLKQPNETVIASAAKQSSTAPQSGRLDCFVALLLAMTANTT
jgi:hypothetical protein